MTTPYNILIAPPASRHLLSLPKNNQKMILKLIEALAINPRPPGNKKIEGMMGLHSQSVDHTQIIYKVEEHEVMILVIK